MRPIPAKPFAVLDTPHRGTVERVVTEGYFAPELFVKATLKLPEQIVEAVPVIRHKQGGQGGKPITWWEVLP